MTAHAIRDAARILACVFSLAAAAPALAVAGYTPLSQTEVAVPHREVFACSADGWLISMNYEVRTSAGPVAPRDIAALEDTVARALAENITAHDHDLATVQAGSFRQDVIARINEIADRIDNRNPGNVHIGLRDGKYVNFCPVA